MVVKGTVRSIKPYGLLIQVEQVCEHLDGSMPRFTAEFNRIHELDLKVEPIVHVEKRGEKKHGLTQACLFVSQALCHVTELSEKYITDLTVEMPDAYHVGDVIKGTSPSQASQRAHSVLLGVHA